MNYELGDILVGVKFQNVVVGDFLLTYIENTRYIVKINMDCYCLVFFSVSFFVRNGVF
jgi:hypothetical protein